MKLWFKKLTVPASNETREVDAVQMWRVDWYARHGLNFGPPAEYATAQKKAEFFTSEQEAAQFAKSLENAFDLLQYTGSGRDVVVSKSTNEKRLTKAST